MFVAPAVREALERKNRELRRTDMATARQNPVNGSHQRKAADRPNGHEHRRQFVEAFMG